MTNFSVSAFPLVLIPYVPEGGVKKGRRREDGRSNQSNQRLGVQLSLVPEIPKSGLTIESAVSRTSFTIRAGGGVPSVSYGT